jgi:uncharacterized integral membrane protein
MPFIIGIILGAATLIFVFQNLTIVSVSFLGWHSEGNLALILVIAIFIGMLISWIFSIPQLLRLSDMRSRNKKLVRTLDQKELELSETKGKLSQAKAPVILEKTVVVNKE